MTDFGLVYDRSETDELGIRLVAENLGIDLEYFPFHKTAFSFGRNGSSYTSLGRNYTSSLRDIKVVLNRTQSKNRRILAASIFENLRKYVINPFSVEVACQSKMRSLLAFFSKGVQIPETVCVPCNAKERRAGKGTLDNRPTISRLASHHLGTGRTVLKPEQATHGKDIELSESREELEEKLGDVRPSIINPSGVMIQEFVPKWFFDLRIIVEKRNGEAAFCHPKALARGGFEDFRTNTFLGNMVFRARIPTVVQKEAVKCGQALAGGTPAWIVGLDAMPYIDDNRIADDGEVRSYFDALEEPFGKVRQLKRSACKKEDFGRYTRDMEKAYADYMSEDAYVKVREVIEGSLERDPNSVLFHEGNACPEFWEQTRIVAGVNIAESLLMCAQSLIDR